MPAPLHHLLYSLVALATFVLSAVWVAGVYLGRSGSAIPARSIDAWRDWWAGAATPVSLVLALLVAFLILSFVLGWTPWL